MAHARRLGRRLVAPPGPAARRAPRRGPGIPLDRDEQRPYDRHLRPDFDEPEGDLVRRPRDGRPRVVALPPPLREHLAALACVPTWRSIAIFFDLDLPADARPAGYRPITSADARAWLDEGTDALTPGLGTFLTRYWCTLSRGAFTFGLDCPRDASGAPRILSIAPPGRDATRWEAIIQACVDAAAADIWKAAGSLQRDGKRWIPSIVLVHGYDLHASARYGGYDRTVGGGVYTVGDVTHLTFSLERWSPPDAPDKIGRRWWGTLCHEYAHNFLELGDLYGPQGATGYWDLLGDSSPPGRMSEVLSLFKARVGWLTFKAVIEGPTVAEQLLSLAPYTTSGEAYKVVPDPIYTPHEYFLLEHRRSTGREVWRPDGALPDSGLLIVHVNERLGVAGTWLLREAPFVDPELADDPTLGHVDWSGHDNLAGKLFPTATRKAFTPSTIPSSRLYGRRNSGLHVTEIEHVGTEVRFRLRIQATHTVGWTVGAQDRGVAGRFTADAPAEGEQVLLRNDTAAALLVHREAQWLVAKRHDERIGAWALGAGDRELVADLDGDGLDELYVRSDNYAGVLKWKVARFDTVVVHHDWIGRWNLGKDNWEHAGDFDGDGAAEVYIRSPDWVGLLKLDGGTLRLLSMQHDRVGAWNLGADNQEFVGRFTQADRDEVAIRSPAWLGLLRWDAAAKGFVAVKVQHDRIDDWNLGPGDAHVVGDFDGDGLDEIYVRTAGGAGLLKWQAGRFHVLWMTSATLAHTDGQPDHAVALAATDRSYAGRFRSDRDGVLHRGADHLAIVAWTGDAMQVHHDQRSALGGGRWSMGDADRYVLGDFHREGPDIADPLFDYVFDGLTDVFLHNAWGTAMMGVNHGAHDPARPADVQDQFGLTWIQATHLLDE